jgi:lysophospholipase L1-like esterase
LTTPSPRHDRNLRHVCASFALFAAATLPLFAQPPAVKPDTAAQESPAKTVPTVPEVPKEDKWESAIARFEAADKKTPPPQGAVLFVGSSSIVKWKTLVKDFPDITTLNRGFGGSMIPDSTRYVPRIVVPYHPRKIVMFAGDNDIAARHSAETVASDFAAFVTAVRSSLPDVPIIFIGIKPSPSRWRLHETQLKANKLVGEYCEKGKNLTFVDVYPAMLGSDGQPRPELFVADKLHMSPAGYAIWTPLIAPYLK